MQKTLEEIYGLEMLNRIKRTAIKFDQLLGPNCDFLGLLEKGLVTVTGEQDGELIFGTTELGEQMIAADKKVEKVS